MTKPFLNQGQIDVMNQIIGYGEAHGFTRPLKITRMPSATCS